MFSCRRSSYVHPGLTARVGWWCQQREAALSGWCVGVAGVCVAGVTVAVLLPGG